MRVLLTLGIFTFLFNSFGYSNSQTELDSLSKITTRLKGKEKVDHLLKLAIAYYPISRDSAFNYLQQCEQEALMINDPEQLGDVYFKYAKAHYVIGQLNEALPYIKKSVEYRRKTNSKGDLISGPYKLSESLNDLGLTYGDLDLFDSAKTYLTESYDFAIKSLDQQQVATVLSNLGYYSYTNGFIEQAFEYDLEAIEIRRQLNDPKGLANSLNNIGYLFQKQGQYDKAQFYYKEALSINTSIGNDNAASRNHHNLGVNYTKLGQYDLALEHLKLALNNRLILEDNSGLMKTYNALGSLYMKMDSVDEAINFHQQALNKSTEVNSKKGQITSLNKLAKVHVLQKDYEQALEYATSADTITAISYYPELKQANAQLLHEIYFNKGDYEKALEFLTTATTIRDSLQKNAQQSRLVESEAKYYDNEKQLLIENLQQKNRLYELEQEQLKQGQKQANQKNVFLLIGGGVLLLAVFLLWRNVHLKRKTNESLQVKNREIEEQKNQIVLALNERETLLKEIHHRVKNNLQTVSSLLSLQSRYLTDSKAMKALEESQSRLSSIALLHQRLYQNDDLSEVHFQEYVDQLADSIESAFSLPNKTIELELDVCDCSFDIDIAVPIGLIINELLTNAYKYAFENKATGNILLSIQPISDGQYQLFVSDNGVGLKPDFSIKKDGSMGMNLVSLLTRQLKGTIRSESNGGSKFIITFNTLAQYAKS